MRLQTADSRMFLVSLSCWHSTSDFRHWTPALPTANSTSKFPLRLAHITCNAPSCALTNLKFDLQQLLKLAKLSEDGDEVEYILYTLTLFILFILFTFCPPSLPLSLTLSIYIFLFLFSFSLSLSLALLNSPFNLHSPFQLSFTYSLTYLKQFASKVFPIIPCNWR